MSGKPKKTLTSATTSAYSLRRRHWEQRNDSSNVSGLLTRSLDEDATIKKVLHSQRSPARRLKNISTRNCKECYCSKPPLKPRLEIRPMKVAFAGRALKKPIVKHDNRNCHQIHHEEESSVSSDGYERNRNRFNYGDNRKLHKLYEKEFSRRLKSTSRHSFEDHQSLEDETEEYLCEKCSWIKKCREVLNKAEEDRHSHVCKDQFSNSSKKDSGDSSSHLIKECVFIQPPIIRECKKNKRKNKQRRRINKKFLKESSRDSLSEDNGDGGENVDSSDIERRLADVKNIREQFFFETHSTVDLEEVPQHRCVHEFVLNERLIPEPVNADVYGTSRCAICSKPMQTYKTTPPQHNPKKRTDKNKKIKESEGLHIFDRNSFVPRQINIGANDEIVNIKIPQNSTVTTNMTTVKTLLQRPPFFSNSLALRFQKLDNHRTHPNKMAYKS